MITIHVKRVPVSVLYGTNKHTNAKYAHRTVTTCYHKNNAWHAKIHKNTTGHLRNVIQSAAHTKPTTSNKENATPNNN